MKKIFNLFFCLLYFIYTYGQLSPNALLFDGVDDYVEVLPSSSFYQSIGTNPFTIEAWIRNDATATFSEEVILSTRDETGMTIQGFKFCITNGNIVFFSQGGGTGPGLDLSDGLCHHVAISRDNTGVTYIYIDGVAYYTTDPGDISSMLNPFIGKSNGPWPNNFIGIIKELRVWNISRTQNEIINNMNTFINSSSNPGLVDYWRMDEGSGSMIANYGNSGNGNIVFGNPIWTIGCTGCALPTSSITASGPTTVCLGNSVTLNANTGTGFTYQWQKNGNNISGATSTSYSASATGNYSIIVSNTCGSSSSNIINVIVDSVTVYLTYLGNFPCPNQCNGALFVLDTMTTGIPPFTYSFSGAGTVTTSPGQTSITGLCALDNVSVTVTDAMGCTASDYRLVEPVPEQNPTITVTTACNLSNGTVTVGNLIWAAWNCDAMRILDDNYNFFANGIAGQSISLPAGNYILETYCSSVSLTTGPCPQYFPFTIPGGITPALITASGSTNICAGNSVLLNANSGTGLSYQWQLNGNNIPGATSSSYSANAAGNYAVVVTDSCGSNISNIIIVTIGSAPNASITASGTTNICIGNSVLLNANTGAGLTYQWKLNGNNISGATSSSYFANAAGNYSVVVTNTCGSSTSNVISVTINSAPGAAITASGSTNICAGNSVLLNANTATGLTYQWKLNGNNISGATSSSYSATTAGNYSVVVSNSCGSNTSNVISVTVASAPSAAITASGSTSFCASSFVTLNANTGTGLSYQWQLNGNNISGAINSTYDATLTGNYSVIVSNNCGNSISNIISVSAISAPGSAGIIAGPDSVCRQTTQFYSVAPVAGATNYVWAVPPQAQIISGAGTNSIVVKFKTKQGNISVKAANQCGAGPLSALPVQVVKCFSANNAVMRSISETQISIYPNPSKNEFNCIITIEVDQIFSLVVFDHAGRIVEFHENIIPNNNFTFGNKLSPGFYFVEVNSGEERVTFKIVKVE